uniref:Zona pellucida sperm-binding protein 4 n=1 Tax=Neogobius melanostomus TaxID=47308 RepID=A0A8C6SCT4_9GOBI
MPSFPQTVPEPHKHCFPYGDQLCPYYPSPYYPYYHPPQSPMYPPVQQPPVPTHAPPQEIQHYCLGDRIVVRLPFAHPGSIQVKDQTNVWRFLSDVPTFCLYNLHWSDGAGIIHSPLPGCHMRLKSDTSTSLSLRYWDTLLADSRTVDVQCPEQSITPPPLPPSPPAPPFIYEHPKESCSVHHMTIEFPAGPISEISVKDLYGNKVKLQDVSQDCGYSVNMGKDGKIRLSIPLHLHCHMTVQGSVYTLTIVYTVFHGTRETKFSCPGAVDPISAQECNFPSDKRLPCGPVSQPQCISMGCCFSNHPPACYYPMDECTADRHFVFSVPASLTEPPLTLPLLIAGGDSSCKPERVTSDSALFKVPMDGCGARRMQVGKTVIYILEVNNIVNSISLNYGTITRDSPVRLMVECRFLPGSALTVSYMVKTPTLGPAIQTQGAFGVQIRIAKGSQYTSFYPEHHQPLQVLLAKPLYLEVRLLNSPDPSLVLLVHYCVAYPRSGKAVWVLLYNGCPNPLDPHPNQVVVSNPQVSVPAQTRRFKISTFQFLPDGKFMDSNEEIYIMCGTELCSPRDGPCVEGCFAQ